MRLKPGGADQVAGLMIGTHFLVRRGIDLSLLGARGYNDQDGRCHHSSDLNSSDLNEATVDQRGQQTAADIETKTLQSKLAGIDCFADPGKSKQVLKR